MPEALQDLIAGVARLYRSGAQDMLPSSAIELEALTSAVLVPSVPCTLPVCAHLHVALAAAQASPLRDIVTTIARVAHTATWLQNTNYIARPPSPSFLGNYGYVEWVGPETTQGRAFCSTVIRVGVLMLGPATEYPEHHHPAEEVYHVIAGHALWSKGGASWCQQPPGTAIHHAPHTPHATKTLDEPLLALYCWAGDINAAACLTAHS